MKVVRAGVAIAGIGAIAYGFVGLARQPIGNLLSQAAFLSTVVVGHDLVLLPAALLVATLVARWAPVWARGPAHAALYVSAVLTVVALPFLTGAGRAQDNPSALPLNYWRGLLVTLGVVWITAAVSAVWRRARTVVPPENERAESPDAP